MSSKFLNHYLIILILILPSGVFSQNYNWAYSIGGSAADFANDVAIDAAGNIFITGSFSGSNVDFDPSDNAILLSSTGSYDTFFAKYTSTGVCVWAKSLSSSGVSDNSQGTDIKIDKFGNVYIGGTFQSAAFDVDAGIGVTTYATNGLYDIFLAKYNTDGEFIWGKTIGGNGYDYVTDIAFDAVGSSVFVSGTYKSALIDLDTDVIDVATYTNSGSTTDVFVAKYSASSCNYIGSFVLGNGSTSSIKAITVIGADLYVAGSFIGNNFDLDPLGGNINSVFSSNGSSDFFIAKYSSTLAFQNGIAIGGTGAELPADLDKDALGNIVVGGTFNSMVDFNPGVGVSTLTSAGSSDIFLAKYDSNLGLDWYKQIGGTATDGSDLKLALDAADNVYIGGSFFSTDADFDPSGNIATLSTNGSVDLFFAKYNSSGGYVYANAVGTADNEYTYACTVSAGGDFYSVGCFNGLNVDFDPSASTANLNSSSADYDMYIAKYSKIQNQSITFPTLPYKVVGDLSFPLNATASSSLTVSYSSSNTSVATVLGNQLTVVGQGSTIITASQAGNSNYNAAPNVVQLFTVNPNTIQELKQEEVAIYPNPAKGIIYFKDQLDAGARVEIISTGGFLAKATQVDASTNSVDVTNLTAGIYFLKIIGSNKISTHKLVLE